MFGELGKMKITITKLELDYGFVIEARGHGIYFDRYDLDSSKKPSLIRLYRNDAIVAHIKYSQGLSLALMSVVELGKDLETIEQ